MSSTTSFNSTLCPKQGKKIKFLEYSFEHVSLEIEKLESIQGLKND